MSGDAIFLVDADGELARMQPAIPASEVKVQELIARYPELIADDDGGLLLIRREHPIADDHDKGGRWSLDHLFVTRNAVPVLVEVKRASDTRLRREVVGQMLDYAANSVAYWSAGSIADIFARTCGSAGCDPDETLAQFIGESDPGTFWEQVDANFSAGRIKLVFVADVIPPELARIVEFLNEQMRADVRAVELRWFEGENNITTLVPRVIGNTARAVSQKPKRQAALQPMSCEEWIATFIAPLGEEVTAGAHAFLKLIERLGGYASVARQKGSIFASFDRADGGVASAFQLWKNGVISISFKWLANCGQLAHEDVRRSFYVRFSESVGPMSSENINGFPAFPAKLLVNSEVVVSVEPLMRELIEKAVAV